MTRLESFFLKLLSFIVVWLGLVLQHEQLGLPSTFYEIILALPVYFLVSFGCYSLVVIGFRVYKFNECIDAAEELQQEINEAKEDLMQKGISFSK